MIKDYCDILIQTIDTMIQGTKEPQRMEYTKSEEKIELNENSSSILLAANPFLNILQIEEYRIQYVEANSSTSIFPLWSLKNKNDSFDLLGVEGEFTTSQKNEGNIEGSYGIQIIVYGGNNIYESQFDSSEMLGDIQNFNHMLQKKVFDVTNISGISYIGIKVYNNSNLNVSINNLRFLIGYNLTKVEDTDAPLLLYSESNELNYKTNSEDIVYENKNQVLKVRYVYKEDGKYRAVSVLNEEDLPATARLRWYRYNPQLSQGDMWGGAYWQYLENDNLFQKEFVLNGELDYEKFKVVMLVTDIASNTVNPIYSNEIVFTNQRQESEEYITDLRMRLADGTEGGYPYYDYDQFLKSQHLYQSQIMREAKIDFKTNYDSSVFLNELESITWSWPIGILIQNNSSIVGSELTIYEKEDRSYLEYSNFGSNVTLEHLKTFYYQIPECRVAESASGELKCEIKFKNNKIHQTSNIITLSTFGTNGTGYSVVTRILDARGQLKPAVLLNSENQYYLKILLYDSNGELKDCSITATSYWSNGTAPTRETTNSFLLSNNLIWGIPYAVKIKCQVASKEQTKPLVIEEIVPIPLTRNEDVCYIGPSFVKYSSEGNDPQYLDTPIYLRQTGNNNPLNVSWSVTNIIQSNTGKEYYDLTPSIYKDNIFQPVGVFDPIMTHKPFGIITSNWMQPIILYQDRYFSQIINDWDGQLKIDEEGNYILASSYVAGGKNDSNQFTGAILGELGTIKGSASGALIPKETGLFGYLNGIQTFGFRTDGTGFIGQSGRGRLNFDGINGAIYSGNFDGFKENHPDDQEKPDLSKLPAEIGTKGTYLNLTDGLFITNNGKFRGSITVGGGYSYEDADGNLIELPYETNYYYASLIYKELVDSNINKTEEQCTIEDLKRVEWEKDIPALTDGEYIWQKTEFKYYNEPNGDALEVKDDEDKVIYYIKNEYVRLTSQSMGITLYYNVQMDKDNAEAKLNTVGFPQNPPPLPTSPNDTDWSEEREQDDKYWVWSTQRSYIEELSEGNKIKSNYIYTTPKLENSESDIVSWCIKNGTTIITGDTVATGTVLAQRLSAEVLTSLNHNSNDLEYDENEEMPFSSIGTIFNLNKGTIQTPNFKVDANGNVKLRGIVEAQAGGKIGNWNIENTGIWYDLEETELSETTDLYFGTGKLFSGTEETAWGSDGGKRLSLKIKNNFGISSTDGTVYAKGKIMATSGEIGNGSKKWIISSAEGGNSYIYSGSNSIASHGGIPSVDVNNIYIGTDGISCGNTIDGSEYNTVIKSGLITTIYQGNSATYIRPNGIYFSYSQYGDFSDSNPASSNVIGFLQRSGTAVNLQLNGSIKGVTTIDMIPPANGDSYITLSNGSYSTRIEPAVISTPYIKVNIIGDQFMTTSGKVRATVHAKSSSSIDGKFIKDYINSIIDERFKSSGSSDNDEIGTIYNLAVTAATDTITAAYIKDLSYGTPYETTNLAKYIRANDSFNSNNYYTKSDIDNMLKNYVKKE